MYGWWEVAYVFCLSLVTHKHLTQLESSSCCCDSWSNTVTDWVVWTQLLMILRQVMYNVLRGVNSLLLMFTLKMDGILFAVGRFIFYCFSKWEYRKKKRKKCNKICSLFWKWDSVCSWQISVLLLFKMGLLLLLFFLNSFFFNKICSLFWK